MINLVIVESPYAGDIERNTRYLSRCLRDCVERRESPYASHALLTRPGVLRDQLAAERALGILLGFEWRKAAGLTVVYADLGVSDGMQRGIDHAVEIGCPIEWRYIGAWP